MISAKCTKTVIGGLSLLLVLSGCSSGSKQRAADPTPPTGTGKTVAVDDKTVTQRPMVDDKTVTQRPIDAAVSHAWKAETAGDAGNIPQMLHHTRLALEQATFAQRKRMEPRQQQDLAKQDLRIDPECRAEFEKLIETLCQGIEPGSGRIRKCYEDNESALTPSCREQVGARKSEAAAMLVKPKKEGELATPKNESELATPKKEGELATPRKKGEPVTEQKRVLPSEAYVAAFGGYLNSGIQDLKETLVVGTRDGIAPSALRDARVKLVRASTADTVRGELGRNERPTAGGASGGEQYIVRDLQNHEMPIALSPEMSQQMHVGDMVDAQIDSDGQVTSITKADTKAE
jgi:hypothetical protein